MRGMLIAAVVAAVAWPTTGCRTFAYTTFDKKSPPRSVLADQPAVRHRRVAEEPVSWEDITVVARHVPGFQMSSASPPPVASVVASAIPTEHERLVVEMWFEMQAEDVARVAAAVIARVEHDGGRVVSSSIEGSRRDATSAALELRVLPAKAAAFSTWLGSQGAVESERTLASDVGKLWRDQELELANLELTMSRLQEIANGVVSVTELLELEKEMTRVRGEIERVKGEHRWLADRVELATVSLTITRDGAPLGPVPSTRLHVGAHVASLVLLDPGTRARGRLGGGTTVHLRRHFTIDLDVFPSDGGDSRAVVATMGGAIYSGHLGFGRRRVVNPYLGARLGYGYLSGEHATVVAGELGVELVRHPFLLLEVAARAVVFAHDGDAEAALHAMFGAAVPF
jgi:hypothetical protein